MLTKLVLSNVQAHEKLVLTFSEGTNYIIGETDSGKSAIIRGLQHVLLNKPLSCKKLRKRGTAKLRITAFINGHKVSRIGTNKQNLYFLDGEELHSFKSEVPERIAKVVNLNADLNFQPQGASYFLLSDVSAPEIARLLERFTDLGGISDSIATARADTLRLQRAISVEQGIYDRACEEVKLCAFVKECKDSIILLKEKAEAYGELESRIQSLERIEGIILSIPDEKDEQTAMCKAMRRIEDNLAQLQALRKKKEQWERILKGVQNVPPTIADTEVENLRKKIAEYGKLQEDYRKQLALSSCILESNEEITHLENERAILVKELSRIKVCPTCGRPT